MLRYPHKDLYRSMDWDPFDDEPEDGHVWTSVGRLVIPSELDWWMSWGLQ